MRLDIFHRLINLKRFFLTAILVWNCLTLDHQTLADPIRIDRPLAQAIILNSDLGERMKADFSLKWSRACELLKSKLISSAASRQQGVFTDIACEDPSTSNAKLIRKPGHHWIIEVLAGSRESTISIFYRPDYKEEQISRLEAKVTVKHSSDLLPILEDEQKTSLIAAKLLTQLPMMLRFDQEKSRRQFLLNSEGQDPPPKEFMIYTLEFSPGLELWLPRVHGYARQSATPNAGRYLYRVITYRNVLVPGKTVWAHDVNGRQGPVDLDFRDQADLDADLKAKSDQMPDIINILRQSLSSNYTGFRYGYPLLKGDSLLTKSSIVGIFAEIRGGPLRGLRWSWDFAPEVKKDVDGIKQAISWNRNSLGWSFNLGTPKVLHPWISQINVFPSIGLLDFDASIPVYDGEGNIFGNASFTAKNSIDLSIEFSVEKLFLGSLYRIWLASSTAGLIPMPQTNVEVSSLRIGIDSYYDLFTLPYGIGTSALLFASYERKGLEYTRKLDEDPNQARIQRLNFNLFFAGFGLALSW